MKCNSPSNRTFGTALCHHKTLASVLAMLFAAPVYALPTGGVAATGQATMASHAGNLTVTQGTQNAVINWQSFNIGSQESVIFVQPGSNAVALNRVTGSDPSGIFGNLSANGKIFLLNPHGILFGPNAHVNVAGLLASTLVLSDSDFMAANYKLSAAAGEGAVLNQGAIITHADAGYVALLGANVSNEGLIVARLGSVELAAGTAMTLDLAGDGLLHVSVDSGAVNTLIRNSGLIRADGGRVVLSAQAVGALLSTAVNNSGVIQAQTIENHQGTILLLGDMQGGNMQVGGILDASAPNAGNGGFIETSAAHVQIADNARISTSSSIGATGNWLIDPVDFTIAATGGDITGALLGSQLQLSNVTISSSSGLSGANGDIKVNDPVSWTMATTLTLDAVHDVLVNAPITAVTAGATIRLNAANDLSVAAVLTGTAAATLIDLNAGRDVVTTAMINTVAAGSTLTLHAGRDVNIGGSITGTAAATVIDMSAGQDVLINAAITTVAAGSTIKLNAGRDVTTSLTAPLLAVADTTLIDLNALRNVNVNAAIAAGAAGSTIKLNAGQNVNIVSAIAAGAAGSSVLMSAGQHLNITGAISAGASLQMIAGLNGSGPGAAAGTVSVVGAVTALNTTLRFNPNGYTNTAAEIAAYVANTTGTVDAKAWVYAGGNNKIYDGTVAASLAFKGTPGDGGVVNFVPGTATFADKNVATGKVVTYSGVTISGVDVGRFALFSGAGTTTADIARRVLVVTATGNNKIYDGNTSASVTLAENRIAGDVFSLTNTAANFNDKNAGLGKTLTVSGINLSGADAANYLFNTTSVTTADITPAALTITANNASKNYGEFATLSGFTQKGLKNNETITSVSATSPGSGASAPVLGSPYAIIPSSASGGSFAASNYTIYYVNGVLTITPIPLRFTAADASKTYGQTPVLTGFTVAGLVNGETVGALALSSPGTAASASVYGSPYVITPGVASGGTFTPSNYTITYVNGSLVVMPQVNALAMGLSPVLAPEVENDAGSPRLAMERLEEWLIPEDAITPAVTPETSQ